MIHRLEQARAAIRDEIEHLNEGGFAIRGTAARVPVAIELDAAEIATAILDLLADFGVTVDPGGRVEATCGNLAVEAALARTHHRRPAHREPLW